MGLMQLSEETSRAAEYLRGIFESSKILKLFAPARVTGGNSYIFIVTAYEKELTFCLTREQIDDLPGTKEYREAANAFARALDSRFKNVDPNLFVCASGRVLRIAPEWPALPLQNSDGTSWIAASGTRVVVRDSISNELAICLVKIMHSQTFPGPHTTPFHRLAAIVNSIRSDVDAGRIAFHPSFEQHPRIMQEVDFRYDAKAPEGTLASQYLQQKVWQLGFRSGRRDTTVWIADPWDASYLRTTVASLLQEAAILDAKELIRLDEAEEFASVGKNLLTNGGPVSPLPQRPSAVLSHDGDRREFDVFISHSSVDKSYVEPLVSALGAAGISVWFDKTSMEWGDSLRSEIDRGLAACRFGIVVFSKAFLRKKKWTEHELNALFAREEPGRKVILPIWHGIIRDDLIEYGPAFADRLAKNSVTDSYEDIVESLLSMLGRPSLASSLAPGEPVKAPHPSVQPANSIVNARYDAKGRNVPWVYANIRPVPDLADQYTFDSSEGDLVQGDAEVVAIAFIKFDRALVGRGYTRMGFGNLSGDRRFDLFH
jgi:TIR domain